MLRLITGRNGCGKTTYIHKSIKENTQQGKISVLIVPEQYSFFSEKKMVELLGAFGADKVEVVSFSFLAKNLIKKYGFDCENAIDDCTRALMMSLALEGVSDKLEIYGRHKYSTAIICEMLSLIKDFRQNNITEEKIRKTVSQLDNSVLKSKLNEISLIMQTYTALVESSYFDDQCALDRLCDILDEHKYFENKTVYIDGFRGFTAQEYKVLERVFEQSDDTFVTLCVDNDKYTDNEFSAFAHTRMTRRRLIFTADKKSVPVAVPVYIEMHDGRYSGSELYALEKNLYSDNCDIYEEKTDSITVCSAEDFESECEYVANSIKRLIRTKGLRCRDIAVISREDNGYSKQIRSLLRKNGIPVFEDRRQPVASQPLIEFVCSAVDIASNGFGIDTVMRILKTGLCSFTTDEIAELENYAILWNINGNKWLDEWTANPNGLGEKMLEKDVKTLKRINDIRVRAVASLQKFRVKLKDFNGLDAAKAIYTLLVDMNVAENLKALAVKLDKNGETELAQEQNRVWDIVIEILDRISVALEKTNISVKRLADLLNLIVSTYSLGTLPQGLDEIVIGTADRVKTNSPKIVFAVGMNDGVFPMIPSETGILSKNERKILSEMELKTDDSFEEKMIEEHFIAYDTLCSASDGLFLTYTRKDASGASCSQSEIITQVKNIFPNVNFIDTVCIDDIDKIEGDASAFELMAKLSAEGGVMHATLKKHFEKNENYSGRIEALNRVLYKEEFEIKDKETAVELFGLNMYMSASRTEVYHKCPFEYFCKFGLSAQPRKTAELDPMQKGTAIHYILEKLISAYGSDGLCEMDKPDRDKCVLDVLEQYFSEILVAGEQLGDRFDYLYRQLGIVVCEVVDRLVTEFSFSEFKPVAFELKIDEDGEVGTYNIDLPDGGTLKIKGSVDRVDVAEGADDTLVRVIDYKSNGKVFNLNEVFCGLNMQMLIYLFAIWKNGFRNYKNIKPAGVLYMPVNAPFVSIDRDTPQDDIDDEKQKKSKMKGMVLDDSRVIYAMDSRLKGQIVPASVTKTGTNSGNLISLKQMGILMKRVEKILSDMAMNLHNGVIPVKPACAKSTGSNYSDVCKYCDYGDVCCKDEDTPKNEIDNLKHTDSLILLGGEDDA